MFIQVEGLVGLVVQVAIFALVVFAGPATDRSRSLFYGAVAAVYGYSLVLALTMLIGVPWGITNFALLVTLIIFTLRSRARTILLTGSRGFAQEARKHIPAIFIVAAVTLLSIFISASKSELSVDGQLYHGPTLVQMIQQGTLWGWSAPSEYLYYSDLTMVAGINLATFTGRALFDDGLQIQHLLVLMFALNWALSLRFRSSFVRATLALLIVSAPVIWMQPRVMYVDLAYGTALASAIFLIALNRNFSQKDVWIAAATIGAVLGTKPAGVITSALLTGVLVSLILWRRRSSDAEKRIHPIALTAALGLPLVAGFSFYVRNQFSFGSPTFPVAADLGPLHFPGILQLSTVSGDPGGKTLDLGHLQTYLSGIWQGISGGLIKLDYDPRSGGFGYVPLIVAIFALVFCAIQLALWVRSKQKVNVSVELWKIQLGLVALSLMVLLVQPASSNSRYVIGPTVVLLSSILMTTLSFTARRAELVVASLALIAAVTQITWNEVKMYPGIASILAIRTFPAIYQPISPGNPWGRGEAISWLPEDDTTCVQIALENSGGVTSGGLMETTRLATFPYGLYGSRLCNSVEGIALKNYVGTDGTALENYPKNSINNSDYLVLYSDHVESWKARFGGNDACWVPVGLVAGDEDYPQRETVIRNVCVAR